MNCENCDECVYVCEGEYLCMKTEKIVITDFGTPTECYMNCMKEQQNECK